MKRRRFFQTLAAAPAATALLGQQPAPRGAAPAAEEAKLEVITPAEAGEPITRFFTSEQFSALHRLSAILVPSLNGAPGAVECHAAEFLDFLCSESLPDRQQLYRAGLDALNAQARQHFGKPFSGIEDAQAKTLLEPLRRPWTNDLPSEPMAAFLITAKADVRTATTNSREYAAAASAGGGRRMGGQGLYWNSLD